MRGVRFIVDESGRKTDVIISLADNPGLWEDICDYAIVEKRETEPGETLESVKRRLSTRRCRRTRG